MRRRGCGPLPIRTAKQRSSVFPAPYRQTAAIRCWRLRSRTRGYCSVRTISSPTISMPGGWSAFCPTTRRRKRRSMPSIRTATICRRKPGRSSTSSRRVSPIGLRSNKTVMTTPGRYCPISPRRPTRRDNHLLRIIKCETGASQSPPLLSSVLVDASVAQKHLIVAGAAAAGSRRAVCGVEAGGERNRGIVIEAAPRGNGDCVVAIAMNSDLAGVALPAGSLLILLRDGPGRLGAAGPIGKRHIVAGAVALVERLGQSRRCDAHCRQHGNQRKLLFVGHGYSPFTQQ